MKFIGIRNILAATLLGSISIATVPSLAADPTCTFTTSEAHYAALASPAQRLSFTWNKTTNKVTRFSWLDGGRAWFSYAANRGRVIGDTFPGDYHLRVNLGVTTTGFTNSRYEIRGYINSNVALPNATFAGIFEGTDSAWIVAYGQLTCTQ